MIRPTIKLVGFDKFTNQLTALKKNIPAVMAKGVNDAAREVQKQGQSAITRNFDRPNKFTQNAIAVKWARPDTLTAEVSIKPLQWRYLSVQVEGGQRDMKVSEKRLAAAVGALPALVPSKGVKLDQYGNVRKTEYVRLLAEAEGKKATGATGKRKRRTKLSGAFVIKDKTGRVLGVFKRNGKELIPLLMTTKGSPRYRQRFDFIGEAEKVLAPAKLAAIVQARIEKELLRP